MRSIVRAVIAVAGFVIAGNVVIALISVVVRRARPNEPLPGVAGVRHLHAVDARVWRSSAPSRDAYRVLAERGMRTVIDLRAERDLRDDESYLAGHGVELVRLPIRDGQTPTPAEVAAVLATIDGGTGITLVHCGAGVGRTGSTAGAYLVATGRTSAGEALGRNLAVGPPSLEQIWYVARLGRGLDQPNLAVKVLSRVLDAPRRIWSRIRHAGRVGALTSALTGSECFSRR